MEKSIEEKISTVIKKNTFYFFDNRFEEDYEAFINSIKETLLILKNKIDNDGLRKELFEWLLKEKENGLKALLALTGFSNEYFKRLITIIRIVDNKELNNLVYKEKWCFCKYDSKDIKEWDDNKIKKLINQNEYFRKGLINLFFEGSSIPFLADTIPLFELKKLSISKLKFDAPEMIDTLVRYKEKGSYGAKKENNPEIIIKKILEKHKIKFTNGDLPKLINYAKNEKRTMDFIIPNKENPIIIIESSFLVTTSSGQGDKSKTEILIDQLLKENYPSATFVGFVDGIGWYVRKEDLKRMMVPYYDVFTFHEDEIKRFEIFVLNELSKYGYNL